MFGPYIAVSSLTSIGNNSAVINKNINMWSGFWAAADSWPHNVAVIRAFLILLVIFTFFAFVCSSLTLKGSENDKLGKAGIMCDIIAWLSALIVFSCYTSQILMEVRGSVWTTGFANIRKHSQTFPNIRKHSQTFANIRKHSQTFANIRTVPF